MTHIPKPYFNKEIFDILLNYFTKYEILDLMHCLEKNNISKYDFMLEFASIKIQHRKQHIIDKYMTNPIMESNPQRYYHNNINKIYGRSAAEFFEKNPCVEIFLNIVKTPSPRETTLHDRIVDFYANFKFPQNAFCFPHQFQSPLISKLNKVCYVWDDDKTEKQIKFVQEINHSKPYPVTVKEKDGSFMFFKNYEPLKAPKLCWKTWKDIKDVVFKFHNYVGKVTYLNIETGSFGFDDNSFKQQETEGLEYSTDGGETFQKVGTPSHKFNIGFDSIDEYEKYVAENGNL